MSDENIWANMKFSEKKETTAYELLLEQAKKLPSATDGELQMDVEAVDGYIEEEPPIIAAIYTVYIVAPKLGGFRKKILAVADYNSTPFPVDIISSLEGNLKEKGIKEADFLKKIEEILSRPIVNKAIQMLYAQSKEIK